MKHVLRVAAATLIGLGAMASMAPSANAWVYSNEGQWASWSSGSYTVYNDVWGNSNPSQWLNVNSASNWQIVSNQSGGGVKSYGNVSFLPNIAIANSTNVTVSYNMSTPGGSAYDNSFDLWSNNGDEIMIWLNWASVGPIGGKVASNQSIDGGTWNVYAGNIGWEVVSFLRTSQTHSGTSHPNEFMYWAKSHGYISASTFKQCQLGFEVTSTSGWQTFQMNSYSASW